MDEYGKHVHPHTHEGLTLARLEIHLQNYHKDGPEVQDWEAHDHFRKVKINAHYSDRIDIHPWAAERLEKAELVFFGIEGCPKADAMLQNIINTGINASVVSVPAVGMWNAPELKLVARKYLRGKIVVIVPDGDWIDNEMVENQARVFQSRLMEYGIEIVLIAAPPAEMGEDGILHIPEVCYEGEMEKLKGVDDFLGLGGHSLADLLCISTEPRPKEEIETWVREHLPPLPPERVRGYRSEPINRMVNMITALSICGSNTGRVSLTATMLANYMNVSHQRVSQAVKELEALGAITVKGDFTTNKSFWGGIQWEGDKPTIELIPELRGTSQSTRLGDMLPQIWGS